MSKKTRIRPATVVSTESNVALAEAPATEQEITLSPSVESGMEVEQTAPTPADLAPITEKISDDEVQLLRAEAAARLAEQNAPKAQPAAVTKPATTSTAKTGTPVNEGSIRQTIRRMLLAGAQTPEITAVLKQDFPGSQAAAKPTKHIGFYRSKMRKAGELPAKGAAVQA